MTERVNHQVVLKSRPAGMPSPENFSIVEAPVPEPGKGEVLNKTIYLSLDPYMRRMMEEGGIPLGKVMSGGTVGQVVASQDTAFTEGDFVLGAGGWQEYWVEKGSELRKLDPAIGPISYALGVLGMPGMTAYLALMSIGKPQVGETVVVPSAAGAVGSVVGQIAKIKGCRVVGIVGTDAKCRHIVETLGFDACINYHTQDVDAALKDACPNGVDIDFETVGGDILAAIINHINHHARVILVGMISIYNAATPAAHINILPIYANQALMQGFRVGEHLDQLQEFLTNVGPWVREGKIKYQEDIVDGLQNAPQAFTKLFTGESFGKLIVRVSPDPTRKEARS